MQHIEEQLAPLLADIKAGSKEAILTAVGMLQPYVDTAIARMRRRFEATHPDHRASSLLCATIENSSHVGDFVGETPSELLAWVIEVCKANSHDAFCARLSVSEASARPRWDWEARKALDELGGHRDMVAKRSSNE